ncbi:MAG: hypothetical protein HOV80_21665 [Polyangiaceae bacterium]|nr:hypothetical protein [Polyangiaceae bacterium]
MSCLRSCNWGVSVAVLVGTSGCSEEVINPVQPNEGGGGGAVAAVPTAQAFGWQGLQEHFTQDGVPCVGEVTVAIGDRLLCYAGADDKLYCAGGVYGESYGTSFVDAGLEGPLQILISPTTNVETGNTMCVVLRDGTMQCRGYGNYNGQLGTGDTQPQPQFLPWHGRTDIVRAATSTTDQYCVLTTSGQVHCGGLLFGGPSTTLMGSAASVAIDTSGAAQLDPPDVFRASAGYAACQVRSAGLVCNSTTKGLPGQVVDGGLIGPTMEQGCLLDSSGSVTCFDLESTLQGPYFAEGQVIALAVNGYSPSICAVYADGSLWCMGPNMNGELGTGDTSPLLVETEVAPPGSVRVGCN